MFSNNYLDSSRAIFFGSRNVNNISPSVLRNIEYIRQYIINNINKESIDFIADQLIKDLFNLKIQILPTIANSYGNYNELYHTVTTKLNNEIANKMQLSSYSKIAKIYYESLSIYQDIINDSMNKVNFFESVNELANSYSLQINYDSLLLITKINNDQSESLQKWINYSLKYELGLIISDMLLLDNNMNRMEELYHYLKSSITYFAAYSIDLKIWYPGEDVSNQLIRNILIIAATLEKNDKHSFKISSAELHDFLHQ